MNFGILETLQSDEFHDAIGVYSTPVILRRRLQRSSHVMEVSRGLRDGLFGENMIRDFTSLVVSHYKKGERLPDELALAALAVVLENVPTDYAEEFLCDLSKLRLAEMSMAIHVARECLSHRHKSMMKTVRRDFKYSESPEDVLGQGMSAEEQACNDFDYPEDHKPGRLDSLRWQDA